MESYLSWEYGGGDNDRLGVSRVYIMPAEVRKQLAWKECVFFLLSLHRLQFSI